MPANIAFVTTSHSPFDDRIYFHLANTLAENNYQVTIIASTEDTIETRNTIKVTGFNGKAFPKRQKIEKIIRLLEEDGPGLIICSEPLATIASNKYRKTSNRKIKIIYDVTEWYPSKKHLTGFNGISKIGRFFALLFLNTIASFNVDGFIFGEYYKKLPYKFLFPFRKSETVGYFPDLKYIDFKLTHLHEGICLCYTGKLTAEKGIFNFLNVIKLLNALKPELHIKIKIIGYFANKAEEENFNTTVKSLKNISLEFLPLQDFEKLSTLLHNVDIFFDLRKTDFENQHCLPIKLFYYAACGRPVIYSNLRAIRKEVDISSFGHLVNPSHSDEIAKIVLNYSENKAYHLERCLNGRKFAQTNHNWDVTKPLFLKFIENI
jgi:glycosyltransferase involved in cell wall biosynthesis